MLIEGEEVISKRALKNQGYCNRLYLLHTQKKRYILRIFKNNEINREEEYQFHHYASQLEITSSIVYFDKTKMITTFLEGEHKESLNKKELKEMALLLLKLHSIKIEGYRPLTLEIKDKTIEVNKAFEVIENGEKEYVLCHNDLNRKNILFSKEIKLIDWEYAGLNDKYFDLASFCVEFELSQEEEGIFLEAYFSKAHYNHSKLNAYKIIYTHLVKEWFMDLEI